jgi:hypothetical protein
VDHEVQMHIGREGHEEWPLYIHITLRYAALWRRVVVYSHVYFILTCYTQPIFEVIRRIDDDKNRQDTSVPDYATHKSEGSSSLCRA